MRQLLVSIVVGLVSLTAVLPFSAPGQQPSPPVVTAGHPPTTAPPPGTAYVPLVTYTQMPGYRGFPSWRADAEHPLEQQSMALARQISQTKDGDQKAKLQKQLSEVLQKQFDAQQKRRQDEIDTIEARLKKLRELMRKRDDAKRTIIERRMDQLIQDAEGLGWSTIGGGQAGWGTAYGLTAPAASNSSAAPRPQPRR